MAEEKIIKNDEDDGSRSWYFWYASKKNGERGLRAKRINDLVKTAALSGLGSSTKQ